MKAIKTLLDAETEEMTPEQSESFLKCLLSEKQHGEDPIPEDFDGSPTHNIMAARIKASGAEVSRWVIAFLATMCDSPGDCVLWAHACKCMFGKDKEKLTMSLLADHFPLGFPNKEEARTCWDSQKGYNLGLEKVDNYLDTKEAWEVE